MSRTAQHRVRARRGEGERLSGEILEAARQLLTETVDEFSVTIRAVADRVGVTTPSVYLHFADKEELMRAVCTAVFDELAREMEQSATAADPLESLRQIGIAYCRFALAHSEEYRVLFLKRPGQEMKEAEDLAASSAFRHLVKAIERCIAEGSIPERDPVEIGLMLWSTVHGATSLMITKPTFPWPPAETFFADIIDMAGRGITLDAHPRI
jgi:AcrR family transcriptional regulator